MQKLRFFLSTLLFSHVFIATTSAQTPLSEFKTSKDLLNSESISNINLQNNRSASATVYGLYVRQFAYVTPGQSCDNATITYSTTSNITAGAFVIPTLVNAGKKAAVGSNYLYNMLYEAIYYANTSLTPSVCALPGCTWGTDITSYNWCIYLGALAPVSTTTGYTASVPPSTSAASSPGAYNYDLIQNYTYLGPITCNDTNFTCTTASPQTQSFS